MSFFGLSLNDRVPDEKTAWNFSEKLIKKGLDKKEFELFSNMLEKYGLIAHEGKIIDTSFVEAPRQHNKRNENEQIKSGEIPESRDKIPKKKQQKDVDVWRTKKTTIDLKSIVV